MIAKLKRKLLCLLGSHDWRRSRFVALNERTARLVCQRQGCRKQKEG